MCKQMAVVLTGLAVSLLFAGIGLSEEVPEGKIYRYKKERGDFCEIEIHFPKDHDVAEPVPGLIMFHGGAWSKGDRSQFRYLCHYFASRGIVAATANYTLRKGKCRCVTDAKSAIRWYKQNAEKLGVDPRKVIAGGGSAGGHVALLATTTPGLNDRHDPEGYDTSVVAYLLFNPALTPKSTGRGKAVHFASQVKKDMPPMVVFFGTDDKWLEGWKVAYKKMKSLGNESIEWWSAEGEPHAFFNNEPWKDLTTIAADEFLKKHGLIEGEPTLTTPQTGKKLTKSPKPNAATNARVNE